MFSLDRDKDTICAVSTAPGTGAIAIVRLSGSKAVDIIHSVARGLPQDLDSHRVYYARIIDAAKGCEIDEVMIAYFAEGRSFTCEPVIEISCHGNPLITEDILHQLLLNGARAAQPGEFTYRAFANGRIDLVQAESVLSLIESRSRAAARTSLRQVQGLQSKRLDEIVEALTWSLAQLEANIDFSSEDIEVTASAAIVARIESAKTQVDKMLEAYRSGRILQNGFRVVIAGEPNVGKSSLFNALLERERSIVSPVAGTTRDTVEGEIMLDGVRVSFVDTAGMRETSDSVEALGVQRTQQALKDSDLTLVVFDATDGLKDEFKKFASGGATLFVANKSDLTSGAQSTGGAIAVSAATGAGVDGLRQHIRRLATDEGASEDAAILSARQFELLSGSADHLNSGLNLLREAASGEFIISEVQVALKNCMQILGREFDDQVIDRVFREFCLGK